MILITGANGLLGSFISNQLLDSGNPVVGLVRKGSDISLLNSSHPLLKLYYGDILDIPSLIKLFEKYPVKKVIHAAAVVSFNKKDRKKMEKVNVEGTRNIINVCLGHSIEKFLHVSTVAALGRTSSGIVNEHTEWKNNPYNTVYGITKQAAELEVWRGQVEGLRTVIVNPSVILAPANGQRSSSRFFSYLKKEPFFYPLGTLNYIDVRDVSDIIISLLNSSIENQRFILSAGNISYKDFFKKAAALNGLKAPSIPVKKLFGTLALIGETLRSKLKGTDPLLTSETLRTSRSKASFDNKKIKDLLDYQFRPLEESINWAWKNYYFQSGIEK